MNFDQLRNSVLVHGTRDFQLDGPWRQHLINQAEVLVKQLWQVGITEIYLDGSFVEAKEHPNDVDGYFHADVRLVATGELQARLNALDPHKAWTWDHDARRRYRNYAKAQLPCGTTTALNSTPTTRA